jgi:HAT1-interacting factor 1
LTRVASSSNGPLLSFSGDGDDEEEETVDLFAQAEKTIAEAEASGKGEGEDDEDEEEAEPEDDFNAAWEVLDLARAIYEKHAGDDEPLKMKLADVYIALGDVSLETGAYHRTEPMILCLICTTEKFDQAITDYTSSLALKSALLPISSRQLAEVHYKLSIALDLTSGKLSDSILHAEKALESVEARLIALRDTLQSPTPAEGAPVDVKGKGKGPSRDDMKGWSVQQLESEIKELEELKEDLALKVGLFIDLEIFLIKSQG